MFRRLLFSSSSSPQPVASAEEEVVFKDSRSEQSTGTLFSPTLISEFANGAACSFSPATKVSHHWDAANKENIDPNTGMVVVTDHPSGGNDKAYRTANEASEDDRRDDDVADAAAFPFVSSNHHEASAILCAGELAHQLASSKANADELQDRLAATQHALREREAELAKYHQQRSNGSRKVLTNKSKQNGTLRTPLGVRTNF